MAPDNPGVTRVTVWQEHELHYWAQKLGYPPDEVRSAVAAVGPSFERVRQYLTGRPGKRIVPVYPADEPPQAG